MTLLTVLAVLAVLVLTRPVVRFIRLPAGARCYWLPACWARLRWPWLSRNCHLSYVDFYHRRIRLRMPFTTAVRVDPERRYKLRYPVARFRADAHGLAVKVKTIPNISRAEFEEAAPYLADAWRCHRVQIAQPEPGRLLLRGLRRDPLAEPFPMAAAPAGVYGNRQHVADLARVYLGLDEWGNHQWVSLANITAAVVGGLPGMGKTSLAQSFLCQLAPSPAVRLAIANGQGSSDFAVWEDRAYAVAGDDRADGAALLEDVHGEMRARFATVLERTGHRNAWHVGPTEAFPLLFLVVDEAHGYLDESLVKGDRQAEAHVRTCRAMLGQLVRRGRSVLIFVLLISQKPTSDAIPSFISANAGLRLCFGVQTVDAAASVLGASIREFPTLSPLTLQGPESVGVLTAQLATAGAPYTRLRVPEVTEEAAERRARETARPGLVSVPATPSPTPLGAEVLHGPGSVKGLPREAGTP